MGAGATNTPLNDVFISGKEIEDMPVLNGVEDEGSHVGVDDPRGVSHQGVDGGGGRDRRLGSDALIKM